MTSISTTGCTICKSNEEGSDTRVLKMNFGKQSKLYSNGNVGTLRFTMEQAFRRIRQTTATVQNVTGCATTRLQTYLEMSFSSSSVNVIR